MKIVEKMCCRMHKKFENFVQKRLPCRIFADRKLSVWTKGAQSINGEVITIFFKGRAQGLQPIPTHIDCIENCTKLAKHTVGEVALCRKLAHRRKIIIVLGHVRCGIAHYPRRASYKYTCHDKARMWPMAVRGPIAETMPVGRGGLHHLSAHHDINAPWEITRTGWFNRIWTTRMRKVFE